MEDATTVLFALAGFRVVSVEIGGDGGRVVTVVGVDNVQGCPSCGVLTSAVHARRTRRVKDLPHGRDPLRLRWCQRRFACVDHTYSNGPTGSDHHATSSHQRSTTTAAFW